MIHRRSLLALLPTLAAPLALLRCAPPPKPPAVLTLVMMGSADQNPDGGGRAAPVAVRVYQLSGTAKFEQTDVFALKDNEAKTLGTQAAAGSLEYLISPGETKTVKIDLKPMVSSIGVAVMYRDIDHAKWRATAPAAANGPTVYTASVGKLAVNLDAKTVEVEGARVHLTGKEYAMLELLSLRKGTTLTKEMFLNHLYGGMDEPELKIIDVFICKLRKKLANASNGKNYIETVWGRGYVLREGAPDEDLRESA